MREKTFKSFLFFQTVAILSVSLETLLPAASQPGKAPSQDWQQGVFRLKQAREFLGQEFKHSPVRLYNTGAISYAELTAVLTERFSTREALGKTRGNLFSASIAPRSLAKTLARLILEESARYQFDPVFLLAVIQHESKFNRFAKGRHGEIGLMQIKPSTAKWVAAKASVAYKNASDLENVETNVKIGSYYLSTLSKKLNGRSALALSAYNMGTSRLRKALSRKVIPQDYSSKVRLEYIRLYKDLSKTRNTQGLLASTAAN